jgi:hypothetical protein
MNWRGSRKAYFIGHPSAWLSDAIIEQIGRSARRVEVQLEDLKPEEIAPAATPPLSTFNANFNRSNPDIVPGWRELSLLKLDRLAEAAN